MRIPIMLATLAIAAPAAAQTDYRSPTAARGVVELYYAAIDRGDFRTAYAQWSDRGRASGKSYAAFRQGFAATAHSRVVTGAPTDGDAGAGSVYVTVPVDVRATLKNGRRQHFRGSYVLRRVNDVDGATRAQLYWHIASAKLRQLP